MISFQAFRQTDGTPIYLQIIRYIQQGLAAGTIQDGDELPSRRVLSALTMLEIDGYVCRQGAGSFLRTVELKEE